MVKFCHLKLDGHQLRLEPQYAWTRNFLDLREKLAFMKLPRVLDGHAVLGELWAPGRRASDVKTLINAESPDLRFTAWAVDGLPADLHLADVEQWCSRHGFQFAPWWYIRPSELPPHAEGYVFKWGNLMIDHKWKPVLTVDAVVTGLVPGKGKYAGMVGALECSVENVEICSTGGFTDDVRTGLGAHCLGLVVEVAYQYVGSGGRLRHPRFIRFRDDKLPIQCTLDQLQGVALPPGG